jgi:hypothetical protein
MRSGCEFCRPALPPHAGTGAKYATTTDYVFNGDSLVATADQQTASGNATGTAKTRYIHPDHLGSTNVVTDENDAVVQTFIILTDQRASRLPRALYVECREEAEREASPTACIIDSQSVKSAEKGGPNMILTGSMRAN